MKIQIDCLTLSLALGAGEKPVRHGNGKNLCAQVRVIIDNGAKKHSIARDVIAFAEPPGRGFSRKIIIIISLEKPRPLHSSREGVAPHELTVTFHIVSFPDPPVLRAKEGLVLRSEFLVVLSQRVRKTGNPIRLLGLKISCDIKRL